MSMVFESPWSSFVRVSDISFKRAGAELEQAQLKLGFQLTYIFCRFGSRSGLVELVLKVWLKLCGLVYSVLYFSNILLGRIYFEDLETTSQTHIRSTTSSRRFSNGVYHNFHGKLIASSTWLGQLISCIFWKWRCQLEPLWSHRGHAIPNRTVWWNPNCSGPSHLKGFLVRVHVQCPLHMSSLRRWKWTLQTGPPWVLSG